MLYHRHSSEPLKLYAVTKVNELTSDPSCANFVKSNEECIQAIRNLINSKTEKIGKYRT